MANLYGELILSNQILVNTVDQTLTAQQFADNEKVKHGASIANLFRAGVDATGTAHNEHT